MDVTISRASILPDLYLFLNFRKCCVDKRKIEEKEEGKTNGRNLPLVIDVI